MKQRNWGIDLLRIVAMMMIVTLHTLSHGGLLDKGPILGLRYQSIWILEILAYCSVNVFALISGYVGVNKRFNYHNISALWLLACFYTVVNTAIGCFIFPKDYGLTDLGLSFFPLLTQRYWYFTAYFCISFFVPAFNYILNNLNKTDLTAMMISLFGLFSVMTTLISDDLFTVGYGYSPLWLAILYLFGGYLKRFDSFSSWSKTKLLLTYLSASAITYLTKLGIQWWDLHSETKIGNSWYLVRYTSPTMVLDAVALLILFAKLDLSAWQKPIKILTPMTFSVYLIHVHPVWFQAIDQQLAFLLKKPLVTMYLGIVLSVLAIYFTCSLVDWLRIKLFNRLNVQKLAVWMTQSVQKLFKSSFPSLPNNG
ncbi:acyltransferase [Vaginisenegalia massiliensis]|uniref:acyltransferase n=1 Tax=Vaginisenegalia massiliensis TaxID=2058294 RepID=UPI000F52631F|nr:acyltransferase [Vaginisenegalia massiliensis]